MGNHGNNPQPGDSITVDPIRGKKDIKTIKALLKDKPRDYCLFTLGINTNLRASDLTRITAGQVRHCKEGDDITVCEKKTGKHRTITLNGPCIAAIKMLLASKELADDSPLLYSQRQEALTTSAVNRLVKSWCKLIKLKGNFGSHTLRKTWAYHHHNEGGSLPVLMKMLNHSSQRQTLAYIGVQEEDVKNEYLKVCL